MNISNLINYIIFISAIGIVLFFYLSSNPLPKIEDDKKVVKKQAIRTLTLPDPNWYLLKLEKGEKMPYTGWVFTHVKPKGQ